MLAGPAPRRDVPVQWAPPAAAVTGLRPAPEFLSLFAPRVHREAYTTLVTARPLAEVVRDLAMDPAAVAAPGSWQPAPTLPFDAVGETGTYDRLRLARLYGANRAMVARGARGADGQTREAWTLISPYPTPALDRLEPGTLVIVLTVAQGNGA
jgi:hypothetical protein